MKEIKDMSGFHPGELMNCAHSHKGLRQKTTAFLNLEEKYRLRKGSAVKTRDSGERWLQPIIRALASEPRRSIAIRALPLPNSVL